MCSSDLSTIKRTIKAEYGNHQTDCDHHREVYSDEKKYSFCHSHGENLLFAKAQNFLNLFNLSHGLNQEGFYPPIYWRSPVYDDAESQISKKVRTGKVHQFSYQVSPRSLYCYAPVWVR